VIAKVTEAIHTDTALGPSAARPRRVAGRFAGLPMAQAALRFARARHAGQHREIDHAPFIAHPIEVGRLLHDDGQPDEIIAAGLLHDILEKTATTSAELHHRFGPHIARLVESVSDDPSIGDYGSRKRDLRDRVAQADPGTRAVFAADKIAKVRELAQLPAWQLNQPKHRAKLAHYRASLESLRRVDGHVPLIHRLGAEVDQLLGRAVAGTPCTGPITSATGSKRTKHRAPAI
jgi:HD domain-containing protein